MTTVAVVPGDGIGPEVVAEAVAAVDELGLGIDFDVLDAVNARTYLEHGTAMTDADFDRVRAADGVLVGAIGHPSVPDPAYGRGVLLRMRFELDLYANYRPVRLLHDRLSPLRDPARRGIDCAIVRENTEGLYAGIGGALRPGTGAEVAVDTEVSTHAGVTRVLKFALSAATRSVCMVDKANAVESGGGLWQRCWDRERRTRPDLETRHLYVDVAAMRLVRDPDSFDVIVTNNSYGDILSDLAAEVGGGLGCAASANLNPETGAGLYEPVHGSAPDIAGTGLANPVGAVLSAALLLDRLGHAEPARSLRAAVREAVEAARCTPDLGGDLDTREAGAAIRAACR
ncbi:isocitrate/isopropylmalate dehydrogenase family protein [Actinosynnema sp. NPDC059797]